jgi:hypothetical protein
MNAMGSASSIGRGRPVTTYMAARGATLRGGVNTQLEKGSLSILCRVFALDLTMHNTV